MADRRSALGAWITARLGRTKKIPPFARLWGPHSKKARKLPPDEAARELQRHNKLIEKLAPETLNR